VINKVYYDVDANHGAEPQNEFIELYNPSRSDIDISNWIIKDNTSQDIIPSGTIIPARGYLLITGNSSTFGYWDIPDDVVKIVLGDGEIGNGLNNDADMLILETPDNNIVDQMNWGIPSESWANYNADVWNPGVPDVSEGHMLGRYPNGWDTNSAGDWKDYGLPSVHLDYPNGGETWYVGRSYTITWTATNPSGNDSELIIDLYYSNDSGNTWANIVRATENDGEYKWRVPLFIGHIGTGYYVPSEKGRIKVVARNKNNFMVSDWDMSDRDFCPPIDYNELTPEEAEYLLGLSAGDSGDGGTVVEQVNETVENFVGEIFQETPIETPVEQPIEIPVEQPLEQQPLDEPVETNPTDTPTDQPLDTPLDIFIEQPLDLPLDLPLDTPIETELQTTPTDQSTIEAPNEEPVVLPETITTEPINE